MPVYQWKQGSRCALDAQKAGEVCAKLEQSGNLTPAALVKASRRKNAALHDYFEWRDDVAAEKYRESQAAYIIRSIEVTTLGTSEPIRAFVSVSTNAEPAARTYIGIERAMTDEETRDEVLINALAELKAFERKYAGFQELAGVIDAIKKTLAA